LAVELLQIFVLETNESLLRITAMLNGDVAEAELDIRRWHRGSVELELSPAQSRFFGISQ
jgi:hypothetical protein